jgi:hypothetical protein
MAEVAPQHWGEKWTCTSVRPLSRDADIAAFLRYIASLKLVFGECDGRLKGVRP